MPQPFEEYRGTNGGYIWWGKIGSCAVEVRAATYDQRWWVVIKPKGGPQIYREGNCTRGRDGYKRAVKYALAVLAILRPELLEEADHEAQ
jgi:hypothetical protein